MFLESRTLLPPTTANHLRAAPPARRRGELAPQEVFHAVWQKRWIAVCVLLFCVGGAAVYLHFATPVYTATSRLYVVPDVADSASFD